MGKGRTVQAREGLQALNTREIEVLQLLMVGHDTKSIARSLDLSIHTVNERLRNARRKTGASSSREAARVLAEADPRAPNFLGDKILGGDNFLVNKGFGVAPTASTPHWMPRSLHGGMSSPIVWLAGGMLIMSLIIAGSVLSIAAEKGAVQRVVYASAPPVSQEINLMPIADTNGDGAVSQEEYHVFSVQGWDAVAQEKNRVRLAELDQSSRLAFLGIQPDVDDVITRQQYFDAIPHRFEMFDQDGDGFLSSDELHGRNYKGERNLASALEVGAVDPKKTSE